MPAKDPKPTASPPAENPIPGLLATLRRQGRLPEGERVARIAQLPPNRHEAALVAEGVVTEEDIAQALARDTGLAFRVINPVELNAEVVTGLLPAPFARRHTICALSKENDLLTVAVANPYERGTRRHRGPRALPRGPGPGGGGHPVRHRGHQREPLQPPHLAARRRDRADRRTRRPGARHPGVRFRLRGRRGPRTHHPPGGRRPRQHPPPGVRAARLGHPHGAQTRPGGGALPGGRRPPHHAHLPPHRLSGGGQPPEDAERAGHRRKAPPPGRPLQADRTRPGNRAAGVRPADGLRREGGAPGLRSLRPRLLAGAAPPRRGRTGAPPGHPEPARRAGARDRADGQRQDDHPLLGAPSCGDPRGQCGHHRGSGRADPSAAQPGPGEPPDRPQLRGGDPQRAAAGPGHRDGGRDPGRRNRRDGGAGGPHRTSGALHPAHQRRPERDHPARGPGRAALHGRDHPRRRAGAAAPPHHLSALRAPDHDFGGGGRHHRRSRDRRAAGPARTGLRPLPGNRFPRPARGVRDLPHGRGGIERDPARGERRRPGPPRPPARLPQPAPVRDPTAPRRGDHRHRGGPGHRRRHGPRRGRGARRASGGGAPSRAGLKNPASG